VRRRQVLWPGEKAAFTLQIINKTTRAIKSGGKLAMKRENGVRFVEAAIPWSEIPEVRRQLDAGQTIKFSFRVNDNGGAPYEAGAGRSVSRINTYAFHDYWAASWANEVEFAFER
jgi:hypothetical protein